MVDITDSSFNLYVNYAELTPAGGYDIFGWAWVRLVPPIPPPMITMSSSSPTMLFDGDGNGSFGEPGDDLKVLANGTLQIMARETNPGNGISVVAMDALGQTGSNIYNVLPEIPPAPTFISLTPNNITSSVGTPVDFSLTVGDGDGWQDLNEVRFVVKEGSGIVATADSIVLWYTKGRPDGILFWNHDTGSWIYGAFGSPVVLQDSHSALDLSGSSVVGSGDTLTLNLA